ncbi:MAG: GntR family transcriptional regulator [Vulcanimicrobiaceae bacterium]|jgi:DNA-binding GntR family transcriptional regulator
MEAQAPLVEPVVRRSLADLAYDKLHLAVIDGALTPGQRLSDATLAGQLGMSRAPVREAISRLESAGLVVSKAGYGWSVVEFSDADIEEIYSLRASYEAFAAERAAQRISSEQIETLDDLIVKMDEESASGAWRNVLKLDMQFHEEMVRAADHVRLLYSWQRLRDQIILVAGLTARVLYRDLRDARRHHEPLLDALRTHDAQSSTTIAREHVLSVYKLLMKRRASG